MLVQHCYKDISSKPIDKQYRFVILLLYTETFEDVTVLQTKIIIN